jgi:hypothetical protein
MDNKDLLREFGRLKYVEPTNFFNRQEGTYSDSINYPYEDYNMAVDLTIRQANRYSCGWWTEDGSMNEITYSSGNGTLSFLGGSGGYKDETYLTTNFTDISLTSPESNTAECLGIESINIEYNSWIYPEVVIKFVDVRGATVMLPAEKGYYNPDMEASTSKIYKSLFSFPYPMFILKVKGFYGKGVTYRLTVRNTQIEFDANTGNFNITVQFIGFMYGIYSDIPMTFIAAAPFMERGKEYWQSKIASGEFTFRDGDGKMGPPMITIPELKLKLAQAAKNEEAISAAAEGARLADNFDARAEIITSLKDTFPFNGWYQPENVNMAYGFFNNDAESQIFIHSLSAYVETVSAYDYTYGTQFLSGMSSLCKIIEKLEDPETFDNSVEDMLEYMSRIHYVDASYYDFRQNYHKVSIPEEKDDAIYGFFKWGFGEFLYGENPMDTYEKYILPYSNVRDYINEEADKRGITDFYVLVLPRSGEWFDPKQFFSAVTAEVETIAKQKQAETQYYKNKENGIIEKVLGFKPSIRNVYELMFAHMDTFVHCFYDSTKIIKDQLEHNQEMRAKSKYGVIDGYSDTEQEKIKTSTGMRDSTSARCKYLPPYTAYYKDSYEGTGQSPKKVLRWLEELKDGRDLEEVNFVLELLEATETYFEKLQDVEGQIELLNSTAVTFDTTYVKGAPSTSVAEFIPLTTFDLVNKDRIGNPYSYVCSRLYDGGNTVLGEIFAIFIMRAYYFISTNKDSMPWFDDETQDNEAYRFGRVEGVNIFKAVRDRYTDGFIKFLKRFADGEKYLLDICLGLSSLDGDGIFNKEFYQAWQTDAPNLNKSLFQRKSGELELYGEGQLLNWNRAHYIFNYHKGIGFGSAECTSGYVITTLSDGKPNDDSIRVVPTRKYTMIPLYAKDMNQVKEYYSEGVGVFRNPNMLPITYDQIVYSPQAPTFVVFDGVRDYIKNLKISIASEFTKAEASAMECIDYGDRDNSAWGDALKGVCDDMELWASLDNISEVFEDTSYMDNVIVDSRGNDLTGEEVDVIIADGTSKSFESLYIKYPSIDCTYGFDGTVSIFDNPVYKQQTDIRAKAWMFIQSVPIYGEECAIEIKSVNGLSLKAKLLREGAYYWYRDNHDLVNFGPVTVFGVKTTFKKPKRNETLMTQYSGTLKEFFFGEEDCAVPRLILRGNDDEEYIKWEYPSGCSASRIEKLKKYFEDWATSTDETSGFAVNEKRLTNKSLYSRAIKKEKMSEFTDTIDIPIVPILSWIAPETFAIRIPYSTDAFTEIEQKIKNGAPEDEYLLGEESRAYVNGLDIVFMAANVGNKESPAAHESRKLQYFLRDLFFGVSTTFDYFNGLYGVEEGDNEHFMCANERAMSWALKGVMETLYNIYGYAVTELEEDPATFNRKIYEAQAKRPFNDNDLKLSTYTTLKSLYDKWLCSPYNGPKDTWKLTRKTGSKSDFDNFKYADSFYNDIGDTLLVNISKVSNWLNSCMPTSNATTGEGVMGYTGKTLYEFLTEVAEDCGGTLMALPQKFGLAKAEDVREMFKPISIKDNWDEDSSTFIFLYTYKPSEHLGDADTSGVDMNGWSSEGDGIDLTDDEIVGKIMDNSEKGFVVPAFGVTYGKQNQTIFKNIQLSSKTKGTTEAAITATMHIASKASESPRESTLYGQDLYSVLSNYSYNCNVETMGNMQILPLMYFQLNNIPFWRGAYMIKKVTHNVSVGNITTTFEGIRQNRYAIPMSDGSVIIEKQTGNEGSDKEETPTTDGGATDSTPVVPNEGEVQVTANPEQKINDTIDFDDANITPQTPLICLTPAHGPKTQKKAEWEWSSKVVDRMVEIMSAYKYKNGKPYNIQRCNKEGAYTTTTGYQTTETQNLIKKYGSDCVVSLVPHWNGSEGNYFCALKRGNFEKTGEVTRADSVKLMECIVEEAKIVASKKDEYTTLPIGAMNGKTSVIDFPSRPQWVKEGKKYKLDSNKNKIPVLGPDGKQLYDYKSTDGAVQLNCACALTENWFADYPKQAYWTVSGYDSLIDGRYKSMRGWLENDGIEIIAQMNAKGIKRYIDTLS